MNCKFARLEKIATSVNPDRSATPGDSRCKLHYRVNQVLGVLVAPRHGSLSHGAGEDPPEQAIANHRRTG